MAILFVALFLGNVCVTSGSAIADLVVNTIIVIMLAIVISIICISIVRGSMGRYKSHQLFKFYWTVPTILSLLSYILVSFKI